MDTLITPRRAAVAALIMLLGACAGTGGLGSAQLTQRLQPGMSLAEVQQLLGPPASTQRQGDVLLLRYSLHEYYKGWVPHYLGFAGEPLTLRAWSSDEAEYLRQQQLWLRALVTTQRPTPVSDCKRGSIEDRTQCKELEIRRAEQAQREGDLQRRLNEARAREARP